MNINFLPFIQLVLKKLYKNSARATGTLRYFREKFQRRNLTVDVIHFEGCEQLFISVGRCCTVEALLTFFKMFTQKDQPRHNVYTSSVLKDENLKKVYWDQTLDKFINEYVLPTTESTDDQADCSSNQQENTNMDLVTNHSLLLLKYCFFLQDFKDAVKEGNRPRLNQL